MKPQNTIAIIGGGFSGISVAVQLAIQTKTPVNILIFNFNYPFAKGVAYHTHNDGHLLNVPAQGMSFFADAPDHFVQWLGRHYPHQHLAETGNHADSFISRRIYGEYISSVFNEHMIHCCVNYALHEEEVVDIQYTAEAYIVITQSNAVYTCHKIIFALGNDEPEVPSYITPQMINDKVYVNNPWKEHPVTLTDSTKDVLLLGSGLTMVDNLISLLDISFKGNVHVVSTKGFLPIAFRKSNPDVEIVNEIKPPYDLNTVFDIFRKHVHRVRQQGISGGAVVAALRPLTQNIWLQLSLKERIRFLSHVRHLWGVARHRLPVQAYHLLMDMIKKKRLTITAGRLINVEYTNNMATAMVRQRKSNDILALPVQCIINCTGPLNSISRTTQRLLQNLFKKNMASFDELNLGLNATPQGQLIVNNKPVDGLFTIGPMLKGILWETTAVNEIRQQAITLARLLL